ncbi:sensor histidine kinase [Streptomyces yanii]|uniref:histidine kinase n=1 Tax=Streptomyces yanii TaxID=78510 RepID=A0ABV5R370_9ACTN
MLRERKRDYVTDLAVWAILSGPVLLWDGPADGGSWLSVGVGVGALGMAILVHRAWPLAALGIAVALSLADSRELYTVSYSTALIALGFFAGRRLAGARPALFSFAGIAAVGLVITLTAGAELWEWFTLVITLLFAVVVPWLIGRYARHYAQLIRTGWQLADRMEREKHTAADRERIRERSRIAGDMHDSLGHELSLIAVRAAALEVDPSLNRRQQASAGELRQAAADATAKLRDIIGILRTDGEAAPTVPSDESVAELVERARSSGMTVLLHAPGPLSGLPRMIERAAHRIVQEALTNAAKHAPGAEVDIRISMDEEPTLTVVITNAARAEGRRLPGIASGGTGLVGLDERVRLAGGSLAHGPLDDGGFELVARLPVIARLSPALEAPEIPGAAGPAPSTSARELSRARQRVRRGLVQVIVAPVSVLAVLGVLMFAFQFYVQSRSVLDRTQFDLIKVGDSRADVETRLPSHTLDGAPDGLRPEPAGVDDCVYYRTKKYDATPVYRLCFKEGRLVDKSIGVDVPDENRRRDDQ